MRQFNGYNEAQPYTESMKLPPGGYVVTIRDAQVGNYDNGNEYLQVSFDISEGQYKDFYKNQYRANPNENKQYKGRIRLSLPKGDGSEQDEWTIRSFKTNMVAIEHSNDGYQWNWDESSLKGLTAGMLFRNKEYDFKGNHGFWTEPFRFFNAEKIRNGEFTMPKDKLLNNNGSGNPFAGSRSGAEAFGQQAQPASDSFSFEEITDEDIPF